jgi:hypothetical protein
VYSLLGHVHIGLPTEIYVDPELEALEEAVYKGFSSQKLSTSPDFYYL